MVKKKKWVYGIYTDDVKSKDRYRVPNFCKMRKYGRLSIAKKQAKKYGDKVYRLSLRKVRQKC